MFNFELQPPFYLPLKIILEVGICVGEGGRINNVNSKDVYLRKRQEEKRPDSYRKEAAEEEEKKEATPCTGHI